MMELRKVLWLRGPNVWARRPMLEAWLDFGVAAVQATVAASFREQLLQFLPALGDEALTADAPRLFALLVLELQKASGAEVAVAQAAPTTDGSLHRAAVEYAEEKHARQCVTTAQTVWRTFAEGAAYDLVGEINRLSLLYNDLALGPSTLAIVEPARRRGIPVHRLNPESLIQLGDGVHRRFICTAVTSSTSSIGTHVAQDKELTKSLLRQAGVPVPEGRPVAGAEDAWAAACEVGLPVVVKPRDANHGRGVTLNLVKREHVLEAYHLALREADNGVLVERFARGKEHRLLVVDGRVVAAARGEPDQVVGDGRQTVSELVDEQNRDPRRGDWFRCPWNRLVIDDVAVVTLDQQKLRPDSIPEEDRVVILHRNGEFTADCTDAVHPEVARAAISAAQVVGLDVAGIDLIAADIGKPLEAQRGVIIEVNAGPGLYMHRVPLTGSPRPVGEAILETLFPGEATGRVPLVAVLGDGAADVVPEIAARLRQMGLKVGTTGRDGMFLDGRRLTAADGTTARAARDLRLNPWVEAIVPQISAESIRREGLGFETCDAAVILDVEDFDAARVTIESISPAGLLLLSEGNPRGAELAASCRGETRLIAAAGPHPIANAVAAALAISAAGR